MIVKNVVDYIFPLSRQKKSDIKERESVTAAHGANLTPTDNIISTRFDYAISGSDYSGSRVYLFSNQPSPSLIEVDENFLLAFPEI